MTLSQIQSMFKFYADSVDADASVTLTSAGIVVESMQFFIDAPEELEDLGFVADAEDKTKMIITWDAMNS